MVVVCAKLEARAGKEREVETALKEIIQFVKSEPGAVTYTLHRSINHPERFFFYERYRDGKAFEEHVATPYFKDLITKIKPLLLKEPNLDLYEEIGSLEN